MATHEVRYCGQGGMVAWDKAEPATGVVEASSLGLAVGEWPMYLAIDLQLFKKTMPCYRNGDLERVEYESQDKFHDILNIYND